jgi:serine/threonine-protein kinase
MHPLSSSSFLALHPLRTGMGPYRYLAQLGGGGMADVYLAVASGIEGFTKLVVVKSLRPEFAQDPEHVAMFLNEARLAARLNHPNVVQTNEVGEDRGAYYLVMEYLEGQTLQRLWRAVRDWPLGRALPPMLAATCDLLAGLHHAHELRDFGGAPLDVVHRDVSPQNVFVTYDGQVKLVDFGIAKAADVASQTRTGVLKGKVTYMAPEQARGESSDRRADVFAAGVILWEVLARARMWHGLSDVAVLARVGAGDVPPLRRAAPDAPEGLVRVCERALAPDPGARFATARAMREAIAPFLAEVGAAPAGGLGAVMVELFGAEREAMRRRVEAALGAGSGSHARWGQGAAPRPSDSAPPSAFGHGTLIASTLTAGEPRAGSAPPPGPAGARGRPPWLWPACAAGAIGALGTLLLRASYEHAPPAAPALAASSPAAPAPATAPAAATSVEVSLRATPPEAKLSLDGRPLAGNPFRGSFERGGEHELRVEAPGHLPTATTLSFERDVTVEIVLTRRAPARERPAPGAAPRDAEARPPAASVAGPGPAPPGAPPGRPARPLELENPY